jgi:hypothetical protein
MALVGGECVEKVAQQIPEGLHGSRGGTANKVFEFRAGGTVEECHWLRQYSSRRWQRSAGSYSKRPSKEEHWRSQWHTILSFVARGTGREILSMSDSNLNPYSSPEPISESTLTPNVGLSKPSRPRPVLAMLMLILGLLSSAMGLFGVAIITFFVFVLHARIPTFNLPDLCAGCLLYLGPGVFWIFSSIHFWKGRARIASLLALIGVLTPIILFSIKGF